MTKEFEQARALYSSDEQMAKALFAMLVIQEAKLQRATEQLADQAKNKRRENR
jgi:hypothetical protein